MKSIMFFKIIIFLAFGLLAARGAFAENEIYTGFLSNAAVGGYDAVAYFTEGKPVKGSSEFTLFYKGADWYFKSMNNLEAFKADPSRYAPQYGGYCAWAVAHGQLAKGDPHHWSIQNGKLYLNYNQEVQDKWLKRVRELIDKADANWPGVIK